MKKNKSFKNSSTIAATVLAKVYKIQFIILVMRIRDLINHYHQMCWL